MPRLSSKPRRSRANHLAGVSLILLLGGLSLSLLRVLPAIGGFSLVALSVTLGIGASIWALIRAVRARSARGLGLPLGYGFTTVIAAGLLLQGAGEFPRINDITTAPEDPPTFVALVGDPANRDRDMSYPPNFAKQQRAGYSKLEPLALSASLAQAKALATTTATQLGWELVPAQPRSDHLEATQTTRVFGFVDDIVVRLRSNGDQIVIDVRSKSRDGKGDMGVNAARIQAFFDVLTSRPKD